MKRYFSIITACAYTLFTYGQKIDSLKIVGANSVVSSIIEKDFWPVDCKYSPLDSLIEGNQQYFPNNFPYSIRLSSRKITYSENSTIGFRSGFNTLDLFGYNQEAMLYYNSRTPYTEVFAVFGMKREQFSKLLHTQNINKQWNIAVNMLRIRSEGFYLRQSCTDNNISLSTNYISKNNRYSLLANGIITSIKADENGGLVNDSIFESRLFGNKKLIPMNLIDSRSKNRHRELYIKQAIFFGKKENILKGDSIIGKRINPTHALSYSFNMNDNIFTYIENSLDSDYYENNFFDSLKTQDSSRTEEFTHGLGLQTIVLKKIKINLSFEQKNRRLVQTVTDSLRVLESNFTDEIINLEIGTNPEKNKLSGLFWRIGKNYILKGKNAGNDLVYGKADYVFKQKKKISIEYNNIFRSVPYIYDYYSSNHFIWKNSFSNISSSQLKLNYSDKKIKLLLGFSIDDINGYVYFDSLFSPKQFDSTLNIITAIVQKNFHLKHFNFNNKITWQQVSSDILHLPEFILNHSFFYEGKWFKKATTVQLGVDISFCSSYLADAYMPSLGLYYWQNKKEISNYPFIDFFLNIKIKRAMIFLKSEHINAGFMGANYYLVPHIPGPDRSLKVGVRWIFYN